MSATAEHWWFPSAPAARLAVLRIATGLFALWYLVPRLDMYSRIPLEAPAALYDPVGLAHLLAGPLDQGLHVILLRALVVLNLLYLVGLWHRFCAPLFAVTLLFVLSYRNSWSMIYHSDNALVLHVLVLSLAPAADALSIDSWRSRGSWWLISGTRYGWPIRTIIATTACTYLLAAIAKVVGPLGWSWALGTALRDQVAVDALRKEVYGGTSSPLAYMLYDETWLFTIMGVTSLALEFLAPLALLHRRIAWGWALATFGMHWGIFAVMDIRFRYCLCGAIFLPYFPIETWVRAPLAWLQRLLRPRDAVTLPRG